MSNEENKQQGGGGDNQKVEKKFDFNFRRMVALFHGESIFKPLKVGPDDLQAVMEELAKEEREELFKTFKTKARELIKKKQEFDRFVREEEKKMKAAIIAKKKEFNGEMDKMFGIIGKIETIEKDYYTTLKDIPVTEPVSEAPEEEIEDGEETKE